MKKLIVFDLDGTLAESKASLDAEMATRLSALLGIVKVGVISGGGEDGGGTCGVGGVARPPAIRRSNTNSFTHRSIVTDKATKSFTPPAPAG